MKRRLEVCISLGIALIAFGCASHTGPSNSILGSPTGNATITKATLSEGTQSEHSPAHTEGAHHEHFVASGSLITDHGLPLIAETQTFQWVPEERARRVTARLNMIAASHELNAASVTMRRVNGYPTVFYYHHHGLGSEGHILATIDPLTASQFGHEDNAEALAYWWRDVLKDHLLLIEGEAPRYTTRYTPNLQRLHEHLQGIRAGVPSHSSFDLVLSQLSLQERTDLRNLYRNVPVNYRPQPDDLHAASRAHSHHHGDEVHAHTHTHDE